MNTFALYLFAFSFGAFFIPIICKIIKIPSIVGEIIYGFTIQLFLPATAESLNLIDFLSTMGFIFLMFLAGMEINFDHLKKKMILFSLSILSLLFTIAYLYLWYLEPEASLYKVIIITASSVGITFIALKTSGQEKTPLGQNIIMVVSMGELISIISMIIFEISHQAGGSEIFPLIKKIAGLGLIILGAYLLIRIILLFFWWYPNSIAQLTESDDISELNVRLAFLILMTMVALSAWFHIEIILGAFLGGLMLSFVFRDKRNLENKLASIGHGFFIPFFFIQIGWEFHIELASLKGLLKDSLILFLIILSLRIVISPLFLLLVEKGKRIQYIPNLIAISFILAAPFTLLIAIGKLGLEINLLDSYNYQKIIITAMMGSLIGPIIYNLLLKRDNETLVDTKN